MWQQIGLISLIFSIPWFIFKCVIFVRDEIHFYGFGGFEARVFPWFIPICIGVGLLINSVKVALFILTVGFFTLGLLVKWIASLLEEKVE